MKRVLIITYYWPPSGGSGVQRWLKMSKYLPENGWQPVIYTTEGAEYPIVDPSLEKDVAPEVEVIRRPIFEPYTFYKKFLGMKKEETVKMGFIQEKEKKKSWKEDLSLWIRGNLFIPDARRWWVKPSVRYLKSYLKDHPVDAIISTGPPHSMHLIAMKLKEALRIPWVADFRDPWTEIDYYNDLRLTRCSDRKHHRLEREVLSKADKVVTVAPDGARRLGKIGNRNVRVVYNGFDRDDDAQTPISLPESFTITYLGVLSKIQNPKNLWQVLGELIKEDEKFNKDLKINIIGQIDNSVSQSIEEQGLAQHVTYSPYIPHDQVSAVHRSSTLLLLLLMPDSEPRAKGLLTGKLFEYLASGRPILCIGPEDGDAARILKETQAGVTVRFEDRERMKETIKGLYQKYLENDLPDNANAEVERYSRRELTKQYAKILNQIES
ncbi:MAG: glycosyltransferase [Bacteroidales bacterium]|nr:glycosyltransferase [Bacteroidales bacterium]